MKTSCIPLALAATVTLALAQSAVQTAGDYVYQGCYNDVLDANTGRTLGEAAYDDHSNMTVESCASFCADAGYAWMGVEYGSECYCGSTPNAESGIQPVTDCSMVCAGDSLESCGGNWRLDMYKLSTASSSSSTTTSSTPSSTDAGFDISSSLSFITATSSSLSSSSPFSSSSGSSSLDLQSLTSISTASSSSSTTTSPTPSSTGAGFDISSSLSFITATSSPLSSSSPFSSSSSSSSLILQSPTSTKATTTTSKSTGSTHTSTKATTTTSKPTGSTHSKTSTSSSTKTSTTPLSEACIKLAEQRQTYTAQIARFHAEGIPIPPYIAGYAAASYDAEVSMGCPVAKTSSATATATKLAF